MPTDREDKADGKDRRTSNGREENLSPFYMSVDRIKYTLKSHIRFRPQRLLAHVLFLDEGPV